ncbi:MAG: DsbA family protein [Pseudobdellovibrionaceae bacterium]
MKKSLLLLASAFVLAAVGCAPNAEQLKKVIADNPDVVFVAIEKDPAKFIEVVNKAARDAQEGAQKRQAEEETKKREDQYANPLKPEIDESRAMIGAKDAKVTIVEYSDFQCPYCARGYQTVKQVEKEFAGKVRILFKHLPLDFHEHAMAGAKYFEAIAKQSHEKAYQFHDKVFENQGGLRDKGEGLYKDIAKKLGLDMKKLETDLKSEDIAKRIQADMDEARKFEITGTPGFLINGIALKGAYPFPEFKTIIDRLLSGK